MGRIDDVLNVAGHRLGTMEIESALVAHPHVAEAAVVSKPHDIKGESVFAYVVLNRARPEGAAAASLIDDLRGWVGEQLSPIAKPDEIRLTDNLPKTRSGKIMRRLLRAIARGRGDYSLHADAGESGRCRGECAAPAKPAARPKAKKAAAQASRKAAKRVKAAVSKPAKRRKVAKRCRSKAGRRGKARANEPGASARPSAKLSLQIPGAPRPSPRAVNPGVKIRGAAILNHPLQCRCGTVMAMSAIRKA